MEEAGGRSTQASVEGTHLLTLERQPELQAWPGPVFEVAGRPLSWGRITAFALLRCEPTTGIPAHFYLNCSGLFNLFPILVSIMSVFSFYYALEHQCLWKDFLHAAGAQVLIFSIWVPLWLPGVVSGKDPLANTRRLKWWGFKPWVGKNTWEEMTTHSSTPAWEIAWTRSLVSWAAYEAKH